MEFLCLLSESIWKQTVLYLGTLQRDGLTTLSPTNLIINIGLLVGATVVVEVINFNTSASSTSVNNVTVTTTIND